MATGGEEMEGRQETEVAGLREQFPGRCRVMSQVGQHTHVVTLQPLDRDATIKFRLKESYPDSPPDVEVRSASLGAEQVRQLEQELREGAGSRLGRPMLAQLLAQAEDWLSHAGLKPGTTVSHVPVYLDSDKAKKRRNKNGRKKKKKGEDEEGESKLPSMRTADDVIKRIQWDDNLEQDDFLVGYLDRFRGLVEKYFSAFSWEDLASVDYTVLAIPHHRIQYFKYRGVVVWDKPSRLDMVFGSTGSKVTITDVIQDYEAFAQKQGVDPAAKHTAPRNADSDDSDDSDDDGIHVTVGGRIHGHGGMTGGARKPNRQQDCEGKRWPTHFLAVRITDEEVLGRVQEVQGHLVAQQPLYADCVMAPAALHVTLCTLGLDTPQEVARACSLLQELRQDWRERRPRQPLVFQGVSTFSKQVVFARVREDPTLLRLVEHIKDCLARAGVETRDSHEFTPHMTIMKMSSPVAKQLRSSKEVDPRLHQRFSELHFGSQPLDKILLCSMGGERGDDGFYVRAAEISLSD